MEKVKKRYVGLDLLRVASALVICAFHTIIHLECRYGILNIVLRQGSIFMIAFFMLSGFTLFITYKHKNLWEIKEIKTFFKKRAISILPMYYVSAIIFILLERQESIRDTILLAPIETLGLQSTYYSLDTITHNHGTWFISCILICYIFYPFFQEVVKQLALKEKIFILVICLSILIYNPIIIHVFKVATVYRNPFYRGMEFFVGVLLASIKLELNKDNSFSKTMCSWWTIGIISLFYAIAVTLIIKLKISFGGFVLLNFVATISFAALLFSLSGVNSEILSKSKLLKYFCSISYVFFLSQLYSNWLCKKIISRYGIDSNIIRIILGWGVCIVIAIMLHEIFEKPITKYLRKKLS